MSNSGKPHVALLASPGMGHLLPVLELADRLVNHYNLTATVFIVAIESSPTPLESHFADIVHLPATAPPPDPSSTITRQIRSTVQSALPHLRAAVAATKPAALIVDLFGTEAFDTVDEFGVFKYVFFPSNAWFLAETLYVRFLDEEIKPDGEMRIPGCKPIKYLELLNPVRAWGKPDFDEYVRMGTETSTADGILLNTWQDLEPSTICALRENKFLKEALNSTPVHLIGPVARPVQRNIIQENPCGLFTWLDAQPTGSVLFVSFGSGGTLSARQTVELAWGLELSQQRFVWVIRPPVEDKADNNEKVASFVPDGFLARTQDMGRVIPMWAPQAEILAHMAVGGFLTHCGWNSTIEALVNGVPLVAWPLYAEQSMNATLLVDARVAVRPVVQPGEVVIGREEIERVVRRAVAEEEIRERAKELKRSAEKASGEGGSSYNSLAAVARECESHMFKGGDSGAFGSSFEIRVG